MRDAALTDEGVGVIVDFDASCSNDGGDGATCSN